MKKILSTIFFCFITVGAFAGNADGYWDKDYEKVLLEKVGTKLPELVSFPFFQYPNAGHEAIVDHFPLGKVLLFGYGSLMR